MRAAKRSRLSQLFLRVLGLYGLAGRLRVAGLAAGVACLVGALRAGNAFLGVAHGALGTGRPAPQEQGSSSVIVVRPTDAPAPAKRAGETAQASKDKDKAKEQQKASDETNKKESYLDAMEAAGFKNLTADELIGMKIQGVTPAYIKEIHDLGMKPSADECVGMR